jgi:hypothetical protein
MLLCLTATVGEGAGLEGVHVALDGGLGFGQLGVGGRQLVVSLAHGERGGVVVRLQRAGNELGIAVEIDERGEDRVFEGVCSEAFCSASRLPVALSGTRKSPVVVPMAAQRCGEFGGPLVGEEQARTVDLDDIGGAGDSLA